jgi:hypothetical protein
MPEPNWEPSARDGEFLGCNMCVHLHDDWETCDAYPDGLPIEIASGEIDHMVERPGQVLGVLFEPVHREDRAPRSPRRPSAPRLRLGAR